MRRSPFLRTIRTMLPNRSTVCLAVLSTVYVLGGVAGVSYARRCDVSVHAALAEYLFQFCALQDNPFSLADCIRLYFGGVCFASLLGFSSIGCLVIPAISAWMGFTSFYTATCFVFAFGKNGIFAAVGLMLIRLLFTLPCFFSVASISWMYSLHTVRLLFGRPAANEQMPYLRKYFFLFVLCLVILCVGVLLEKTLTPLLFRTATDCFHSFL